jgi:heme A synthase
VLAAITGLLITSTAITGVIRLSGRRWIVLPPLIAFVLLIEVSYLGAEVVLRGLSPGWSAVDLGSALLVEALMVSTAVIAYSTNNDGSRVNTPNFTKPLTKLVMVTILVVYFLLVSGVLVGGNNFITTCIGWPIYSLTLARQDASFAGSIFRIVLSIVAMAMLVMIWVHSWKMKQNQPAIFKNACLVGFIFVFEMMIQALLLIFNFSTPLLVMYTITAALFWGLLVALLIRSSISIK